MHVTALDVRTVLAEELHTLRRDYSVKRIGLFGSYARGQQRPDSDVDLLVDFSRTPGLFRFVHLRDYLAERLGAPVDLVTRAALKPDFRDRVLETVEYIGN
jgi:predicted nucleotidyltransferase